HQENQTVQTSSRRAGAPSPLNCDLSLIKILPGKGIYVKYAEIQISLYGIFFWFQIQKNSYVKYNH
ncbi:MAG: hypothetical protein K2L22_00545, partial [Muribaculaceae bacterium]|nr:hypothetical protein [Muribaculaceae bacterium]